MRLLAEAVRAAGNVFLTPLRLTELPAAASWGRGLMVGSRNREVIARASAELRRLAPALSIDIPEVSASGKMGVLGLRRRGYDVVCLLLTGEGRHREKLRGLFSRAQVALAFGASGRWYRVNFPQCRPGSLRWWARLALTAMLCLVCLRIVLWIWLMDTMRRCWPLAPAVPDPGQPAGRETTFIVPTHNQKRLMDFCLPPLLAEAGREHRVMVVDDASTDGTAEYVRQKYPSVRLVRLRRNRGFAGAVRAGIAACETPLFALINTDVQVRPGFLRAMLPHFDRPDTFAVCSRIELPGGSLMETGNVAPAFSGILEPYHVAPTRPGPILYAGGASSVFHRVRCQALGGLETIYRPLYWEDIELGYRAWRRGWQSVFEPGASVWHERRAWIGRRFGDAYANETFLKNALLFVWKNVRDRGLLAQHFAYVCARLAREIMVGEETMCRALLRAAPLCGWMLLKRWGEHHRGDLGDREILALASPPGRRESEEVALR